jgi:hypothetical protein
MASPPLPSFGPKSVTHVSGTFCYLCLRPDTQIVARIIETSIKSARRERVTKIVEPEATPVVVDEFTCFIPLALEHTSFHCSGPQIIFDQHVSNAGLLPFELDACENPVGRL